MPITRLNESARSLQSPIQAEQAPDSSRKIGIPAQFGDLSSKVKSAANTLSNTTVRVGITALTTLLGAGKADARNLQQFDYGDYDQPAPINDFGSKPLLPYGVEVGLTVAASVAAAGMTAYVGYKIVNHLKSNNTRGNQDQNPRAVAMPQRNEDAQHNQSTLSVPSTQPSEVPSAFQTPQPR